MFQLALHATTVASPSGSSIRLVDVTDWTQASPPVRSAWAVFLSGTQVGSVAAQDVDLKPVSYDPALFQSPGNPAGTVDVPLDRDGVYRLRAVAVPVLANAAALAAAAVGKLYYRLDLAQFLVKINASNQTRVVLEWDDVLFAQLTDPTLLDYAGEAFARSDFAAQAGLAQLNLKYLEAGSRTRAVLLNEYVQAELLLSGSSRQFNAGFYADAATSLTASERLLGACLPGFAQSLPALSVTY